MENNKTQAQLDWQAKLEKYPSLRKFDELGDDYVEVYANQLHLKSVSLSGSGMTVAKRRSSSSSGPIPK